MARKVRNILYYCWGKDRKEGYRLYVLLLAFTSTRYWDMRWLRSTSFVQYVNILID